MGKKGKSSYARMQQSNQRSSNYRVQGEKQAPKNANENGQKPRKKERGVGLLKHLYICPEYRQDGGVTPPLEEGMGRFRYFWSVGQRRNGSVMVANLMFVIFLLPLLAVFAGMKAMGGAEKIAYLLKDIEAPYLMTDIGFGISSSAYTAVQIQGYMQEIYYVVMAIVAFGCFVMSIGLSGMMPLCMKFITGDTFASKKDNYGNDVPKAITEFFRGMKKYIVQYLIVGAMMLFLVGAVGEIFVFFVGSFQTGVAGAGHWILMIFGAIVGLLGLMFLMHLMPIIVLYDIPFVKKMQNAGIFALQMFLQNFFILSAFSAPFLVVGLTNDIISSVMVAVLLVFGSKYYCLTMCNFSQYISEKITTPLYTSLYAGDKKKKKKSK